MGFLRRLIRRFTGGGSSTRSRTGTRTTTGTRGSKSTESRIIGAIKGFFRGR